MAVLIGVGAILTSMAVGMLVAVRIVRRDDMGTYKVADYAGGLLMTSATLVAIAGLSRLIIG